MLVTYFVENFHVLPRGVHDLDQMLVEQQIDKGRKINVVCQRIDDGFVIQSANLDQAQDGIERAFAHEFCVNTDEIMRAGAFTEGF